MAESLVDFHGWKTKSLGLSSSPPSSLCWPCRVQAIDKGFCPCHQGLMSFCQLPGSPVPHSVLLFCFASIPDRFPISPPSSSSLLPLSPNSIHRPCLRGILAYRGASGCSLRVIVSIRAPFLHSHCHHLIKRWETASLLISVLSSSMHSSTSITLFIVTPSSQRRTLFH